MASVLSYVFKFKSFLLLFASPLLLLPLVILVPTKVSCISRQPRGLRATGHCNGPRTRGFPAGTAPPGALGARLDGRCPVKNSEGRRNSGAHQPWGLQIPGHKNRPNKLRNLEVSADLGHTAHS